MNFFSISLESGDGTTRRRRNPKPLQHRLRLARCACCLPYCLWPVPVPSPGLETCHLICHPSLIGSSTRACCQRGLYEAVALILLCSKRPNGPPFHPTPLSRLIPLLPDTRSAARTSLELDLTGFSFGCAKASLFWNWNSLSLPKRLLFLSPSYCVPANGFFL